MNKLRITRISIYILSIIVTIICWISPLNQDGYEWMALLPATFGVMYILCLEYTIIEKRSLVGIIFTISAFLRYIVMPFILSLTGYKYVSIALSPDYKYIVEAIYLMSYELIATSIAIYVSTKLILNKEKKNFNVKICEINNGKIASSIIICLAIILLIFLPSSRDLIGFLTIKGDEGVRKIENLSMIQVLVRQIIFVAVIYIFIHIVSYCIMKYNKYKNSKYILYSLFAAMILVCIIIGERRTNQAYLAFASSYVLSRAFPKHSKKIVKSIFFVAAIILIGMSIYKHTYAFLYDSYIEAIANSKFSISDLGSQMQAYLLGPFNVGASLEIGQLSNQPILRLIYDIGRSIMGIHFLFKGKMLTTSDIFNIRMYGEFRSSGQIIPISGQGYIYFGFVLSPIILILILISAVLIESKMKTSKSIEEIFILSYILMRLASSIIMCNLQGLINTITLFGISMGLVYISNIVVGKIIKKI